MAGGPETGSGRSDAPVIDWKRAARLVARGTSVRATAEQVGCSRSQLSRKKNHCQEFISWVEAHRRGIDPERGKGLADLRDAVRTAIEAEVRSGNVRVILWLADRLKLAVEPDDTTPENQLDRLMRDLSPTELAEFRALQDGS